MSKRFDLTGRTILLTGATRGIGMDVALRLGAEGAKVLAVARDDAALGRLAAANGFVSDTLPIDLAGRNAARTVAEWVAEKHPETSVLINNAAIMLHAKLTDAAIGHMEDIAKEIAVNLTAPLQLATAMLPILQTHALSAIVNVTSGLAIAPKRNAAVYCATKAALRSFTRSLRDQCNTAGLSTRVVEVVMTLVDTELSGPHSAAKYPAARAAEDLIIGLQRGVDEIWVEKTKLLRAIHRISPAAAYAIMRGR